MHTVLLLIISQVYIGNFAHVHAISPMENGFVAATSGGFYEYSTYKRNIVFSLPGNNVKLAVKEKPDGSYIFYIKNTLYRYDPFSYFLQTIGIFYNIMQIEAENGYIKLIAKNHIEKIIDYTGSEVHYKFSSFAYKSGYTLHKDDSRALFLNSYSFEDGCGHTFPISCIVPYQGNIYVGTSGHGVYIFDTQLKTISDSITLTMPDGHIKRIKEIANNIVFLGHNGISVFKNGYIKFFPFACLHFRDNIVDITAYKGKIGLLGEGSLQTAERFSDYTPLSGKFGAALVASSDTEGIAVGTEQGIIIKKQYGEKGFYTGRPVTSIAMWKGRTIANTDNAVYIISDTTMRQITDTLQKSNMPVRLCANKDALFILTKSGIIHYTSKGYSYIDFPYTAENATDMSCTERFIAVVSSNNLYIYDMKHTNWKQKFLMACPFCKVISAFVRGNTIYVGTDRGIAILKQR